MTIQDTIAEQNEIARKIFANMFDFIEAHTGESEREKVQEYLHSRDRAILQAVIEMSEKLNCTSFNIRNQDVAAYRAGYDAGVADVQEMIEKI